MRQQTETTNSRRSRAQLRVLTAEKGREAVRRDRLRAVFDRLRARPGRWWAFGEVWDGALRDRVFGATNRASAHRALDLLVEEYGIVERRRNGRRYEYRAVKGSVFPDELKRVWDMVDRGTADRIASVENVLRLLAKGEEVSAADTAYLVWFVAAGIAREAVAEVQGHSFRRKSDWWLYPREHSDRDQLYRLRIELVRALAKRRPKAVEHALSDLWWELGDRQRPEVHWIHRRPRFEATRTPKLLRALEIHPALLAEEDRALARRRARPQAVAHRREQVARLQAEGVLPTELPNGWQTMPIGELMDFGAEHRRKERARVRREEAKKDRRSMVAALIASGHFSKGLPEAWLTMPEDKLLSVWGAAKEDRPPL